MRWYTDTHTVVRLRTLYDALVAASIPVATLVGTNDSSTPLSTGFRLQTADTVTDAQIQAVLNAGLTGLSAGEQQEAADGVNLSDLAATYVAMVTKLDSMQTDMATLSGHANTLGTLTLTGTTANQLSQIQGNLRALGTDLKTLVDDVNAFAGGSERVLKVARVIVRRQGGG